MAYYNSRTNERVSFPPQPVEGYPDWEIIDCGCCAGVEWGGEYPRECKRCGGEGYIFRHKKSIVLAEYPGGKFLGREPYRLEDNK